VIVRGAGVVAQFARVHFGAVNHDGARGSNAEANLVTVDAEDGDRDVRANLQGFCRAAGENQHTLHSLGFAFSLERRAGGQRSLIVGGRRESALIWINKA